MSDKILSKDMILAVNDQKIEKVPVPEWGGMVYVRSLSGTERDAFEASMATVGPDGKQEKLNLNNFRARLSAMAICDQDGKRLFSDQDATALGEKNIKALLRIYMTAARLSALRNSDMLELMEALKNARKGDSTSA